MVLTELLIHCGSSRSHALHLSDDGRATLRRLTERVRAHERQIARHLSTEEQARLIELLRRVARD